MEKIKIKNYLILEKYKIPWIIDDKKEKINERYYDLENLFHSELYRKNPDFDLDASKQIKPLFNYALRISGEIYDPEELLNDTFIRAFRFYHKFNKQVYFNARLKMIMRNCFINRYRKCKQNVFEVFQELDNFDKNIISNSINKQLVENNEFLTFLDLEIIKIFKSLQNEYKSVMILKYIEGFNEAEISLLFNLSVDKVINILLEGRNYLQEKLNHFIKLCRFAHAIKLNAFENTNYIRKSVSM
jgi:RNA polymerase sigma-70 factor, ECF subfamily